MHDIRNIPTFPHSVPKKVEDEVEQKVVLIPDAEHPMFKENSFGATSMNGELLSLQCPNGIAVVEQVDAFQFIITFRFPILNVPDSYCDSALVLK